MDLSKMIPVKKTQQINPQISKLIVEKDLQTDRDFRRASLEPNLW